ncbi:hypothetical protein DIURU_000151 [Diutina rugosa]|uniref:Ornithine cyclodeaminase n=1 Tax=Diutina rugosa TaxID=5481 RepID=A0A642UZ53_DIURU|nr:uncharacterized protein DIURU_000151 [Diutina rugosa]KAA8908608.1 hypothetical protein DIURU_000151 [Diutina rugosa]
MVLILSDNDVAAYLDRHLTQQSLLDQFIPHLHHSLQVYGANPDAIVPPRTVQESNNPESDTTHLYMPCISPDEVGIKIISGGPGNNQKGLGFAGCVLVLDEITGEARALLNGATLTAFRTALASMIGATKVVPTTENVTEIAVFGVGRQAEWHIKLALLLYPSITTVRVFNRSQANADKLVASLTPQVRSVKWTTGTFADAKATKLSARLVFGCCPSTEPVIVASALPLPVFISLIGSYKPHMIELDVSVVHQVKNAKVPIIVDSKDHCLHEAGELIQGDVTSDDLVELAQLDDTVVAKLRQQPVVVQKLVGLAIMDVSVAKLIVDHSDGAGAQVDF